jgi:alkylation response protein AidB-like acyl-CoA dehydrogenase
MDLDLNDEQQLLRDTVRRICETLFDTQRVRALEGEPDKLNREFWDALGTHGLCALRIDEAHGGAGMGALDLALVFEEFGRALASSPFLSSCVLSAKILASLGSDVVKEEWLPRIASGEAVVIPAWQGNDLVDGAPGTAIDAARGVVTGEKLLVPFASVADLFLVHGNGADGAGWALVPADAKGVSIVAQPNYASQALFAVHFDDAAITGILAEPEALDVGAGAFGDVLIAVAAEAVGASDRLLALTADYANQRNQFDRPIAGFQAVSHPLADCATELEGVRYLVYQAAWAKDGGMPYRHLAQMAKLQVASLFRRLATVSVQVHGGIGYSTEGDPQLFYRRSKFHELMYGTAADLKAHIADHVFA